MYADFFDGIRNFIQLKPILAYQSKRSGSGRAGRLRLMGKYIGHCLLARPELDNTFWTDSTFILAEKVVL